MVVQRVGHDWATFTFFQHSNLHPLPLHCCCCLVAKSCPTPLWPHVAHQAPLCMGFPRQEYWSGLMFPSPPLHYHNSIIQICNNFLSPDSSTVLPKCVLLLSFWKIQETSVILSLHSSSVYSFTAWILGKLKFMLLVSWLIINVGDILHQPPHWSHPITYTSTTISKSGSYKI